MPPFAPGEVKTAIAPITAKPSGMSCEAELFLGPDPNTKAVTSGRVPFVSTGVAKNVSLPINMPSTPGTYHGYIDVFTGDLRFLAYILKEDVVIAAPQLEEFFLPPQFTKAKITSRWEMAPYYYVMEFECPITNKGNKAGTHTITVNNNHPDLLPPWSFELTLGPGETYLWKHSQMAIWPVTFYLEGDWTTNNYSVGTAAYSGLATLFGSVFMYVPNWSTWIIPLANITVQLWTYNWSELLATVYTGSGNTWEIPDILPGTYMLYWQREGYTPVERQVILVANTEQKHDIWMVDPLIYP